MPGELKSLLSDEVRRTGQSLNDVAVGILASRLAVPFEPSGASRDPMEPERFASDIADRVNELLADPGHAKRMGEAGRRRAIEHFAWPAIARETAAVSPRWIA